MGLAEDTPTLAPAQIRRTATVTVGLLMGVWVIDYVDRVMMAVALPFIGEDFALTKTEQGWLITAFSLVYLLCQIPGGILADRFGARRQLMVSLVLWSVFTALTGIAWGLASLLVIRALFGVGQGLFPGASFKAIAERTTPTVRATAAGAMLASNQLGAGVAPLIVAPLILVLGWRHTFWVTAAAGVAIGVLLWKLLPKALPAHLNGSDIVHDKGLGLGTVMRSPSVWKFAALFCATNMLGYGLITWVPSYLLEERGISLINTGVMSAIPGLVMCATVFLGGWLFDRFFHDRARLFVIPLLLVTAVLLVLMLMADSAVGFTVYQTLAMGVAGLSSMGILGMPVRALPPAVIGSGMSVVNVGGQIAGVLAPVLMGFLVDRFSYTVAFGLLIATTVLGALIALIVPQRPEQFSLATKEFA
ncbi:MFS transporter [Microtetraspora malaysiensis]|uniref:MFS transporter n=1 Tax=Microtetraspora malaysiensis TaxID=161358 RepID=UPI0008322FED|nr:MFS transporter [Microtetraspora malaysiensis]